MHIPLQIDTSVLLTSGEEAITKKKRQKQQQPNNNQIIKQYATVTHLSNNAITNS